jgi:hypothetical protein
MIDNNDNNISHLNLIVFTHQIERYHIHINFNIHIINLILSYLTTYIL